MKNLTGNILSSQSLSGGDINRVFLLTCEKGKFVLKSNNNVPGDFFQKEAAGLKLLRENGLHVPEVLDTGNDYLLMEYLAPGKKNEADAGRQLARIHSIKQAHYGLEEDNYIGSLKQKNGVFESWPEFYIKRRIDPQLNLLFNNQAGLHEKIWDNLRNWVYRNVVVDFPSLLHGDIWSGNLYYSSTGPIFIDPAVYRGHYMIDLAFTEMFGGFGPDFYSTYNEILHIDASYKNLKSLYQIYPMLVHANLFGGSYYTSALELAKKYT